MMRKLLPAALLLTALPGAAFAQAQPKCGQLQVLNTVQMKRMREMEGDVLPITIQGKTIDFRLSTGSPGTLLTFFGAGQLGLKPAPAGATNFGNAVGVAAMSAIAAVKVDNVGVGQLQSDAATLPVLNMSGPFGGAYGMEYIAGADADFDFGTDVYRTISPDHCPGAVIYWKADTVGIVPIAIKRGQVTVDVTLDGHVVQAVIDTAAPTTRFELETAEKFYDVKPGTADTPELPDGINGHTSMKTYSHTFKELAFGEVKVLNPRIKLFHVREGYTSREGAPTLSIGMDVLRKLHLYFAFREGKMYVTAASPVSAESIAANTTPEISLEKRRENFRLEARTYVNFFSDWTKKDIRIRAIYAGELCWWRSSIKENMGSVLEECEQALRIRPADHYRLTVYLLYKGFALYQMGRYDEALNVLNTTVEELQKDTRSNTFKDDILMDHQAEAILLRGYTKGRLGDTAGKSADVSAAIALYSEVETQYLVYGIAD